MTMINLGRIGMLTRGTWNSLSNYKRLDVVTHLGSSYVAVDDNTNTPVTNASYWQVMALQGQTPEYEWSGTSLRFRQPNGVWGSWIDLKGEKGDPFVYEDFTQEQISDLKSNLETAVNEAHNFDNGKTYRWGLKIVNGKTQFMYEEVVE